MNCRCVDSVRPVSLIASRSFSEASCRYHSSQWLPIPCNGPRNSEPSRKLSLLQCQKVQNQTKRIVLSCACALPLTHLYPYEELSERAFDLSLIHISEPTRLLSISYAVFCLKKKR